MEIEGWFWAGLELANSVSTGMMRLEHVDIRRWNVAVRVCAAVQRSERWHREQDADFGARLRKAAERHR